MLSIRIRIVLAIVCILTIGLTTGFMFWEQEVQYQLPTPKPSVYTPVIFQAEIRDRVFANIEKPIFLHFFNPECPCSKFNSKHVLHLIKVHQNNVQFMIVVPEGGISSAKNYFSNNEIIIEDNDKKLAQKCGVYSTPQAVIIDKHKKLWYVGNYNQSRYCTKPESNFAEIALEELLQSNTHFIPKANVAYGCSLYN